MNASRREHMIKTIEQVGVFGPMTALPFCPPAARLFGIGGRFEKGEGSQNEVAGRFEKGEGSSNEVAGRLEQDEGSQNDGAGRFEEDEGSSNEVAGRFEQGEGSQHRGSGSGGGPWRGGASPFQTLWACVPLSRDGGIGGTTETCYVSRHDDN